MFVLVIVMSLTVGKIRGQLATAPGAINERLLSTFPLDPRTFTVPEQVRLLPQAIPRKISVQPRSTDRLEPSAINSGGDLNLRPPTIGSRPNRRILISERSPDITSRPNIVKIDSIRSNTNRNNTPVKNQENMNPNTPKNGGNRSSLVEQNDTSITKPVTNTRPTDKPGDLVVTVLQNGTSVDRSRVNGSKEMDGTTGKPTAPTVIDKATGVEVTLDERASFDGDKCPTGFVRINGMCVEKD